MKGIKGVGASLLDQSGILLHKFLCLANKARVDIEL